MSCAFPSCLTCADPFERGDQTILYDQWVAERAFVQVPLQAFAAKWLSTFQEFPPRQKPASFNLDKVVEQLSSPASR
jgi:hypothetical protein